MWENPGMLHVGDTLVSWLKLKWMQAMGVIGYLILGHLGEMPGALVGAGQYFPGVHHDGAAFLRQWEPGQEWLGVLLWGRIWCGLS